MKYVQNIEITNITKHVDNLNMYNQLFWENTYIQFHTNANKELTFQGVRCIQQNKKQLWTSPKLYQCYCWTKKNHMTG